MRHLVIALSLFSLSFESWAFGVLGHQLVAYIAQQQLSPETNKQVAMLLNGKSMINASTWADQVRKNDAWKHTGPWHYINIPKGKSLQQAQRSSKGDILSQLQLFEQQLSQTTLPPQKRQQALKFYIHFVADLHQPLHVAYAKDRGGNTVRVKWYGKTSNLHRVWDSQLLDRNAMSVAQYAKQLIRDYPQAKVEESYPQWLNQTRQLVPLSYQYTTKNLADSYANKNRPVVEEQIVKAGYRLANKLNQLFDPSFKQ
ncbi:S1/P1 nuclease [Agarivorans sp. MS3-6]|uniref:S1/P1 nuclease n=1 Tax=Agarivorans sp. TSD2052 TaxID=2937286 RepID=UPI00200FAA21|nr:S1/P1 nuclease [Agarivorans sp. TSD2052]UPW17587.1 S1/P1 nuclease [Agarivorans sp. TSD2052]